MQQIPKLLQFFLLWVTLTLGLITPVCWSQDADYTQMLADADRIRSVNPVEFKKQLEVIPYTQLNPEDKLYYRYLDAYGQSISGDVANAIESLLQLRNETRGDLRFRVLASLVNLTALQSQWERGLEIAGQMVDALDKVQSKRYKGQGLGALSIFYNQMGDHDTAEYYANALLKMEPSPRLVCLGQAQRAEVWLRTEKNKDALYASLPELIAHCESIGEIIMKLITTSYLAELYLSDNEYRKALNILTENLAATEATRYSTLISGYYALLAKTYFETGDTEQAAQFASAAVNAQTGTSYRPALIDAFNILYQVAESKRDYQQALIYHKSYLEAVTNEADLIKTKAILIEQARLSYIEKSARIQLLDKENALLTAQARLAEENARNGQLGLLLAATLILMLVFWLYRNRRTQVHLKRIAQTDGLTGIANRFHFTRLSQRLLEQCNRESLPVSLILFDLDHFKTVNDRFGHQTGDMALKHAVEVVEKVCRANDVIGRVGGEEFAITLPGCALDKAQQLAEICRQNIENTPSDVNGNELILTASFGVADAATCGYHFDAIFAGADKALYQSKDHGRNRVYPCTPELLNAN